MTQKKLNPNIILIIAVFVSGFVGYFINLLDIADAIKVSVPVGLMLVTYSLTLHLHNINNQEFIKKIHPIIELYLNAKDSSKLSKDQFFKNLFDKKTTNI